MTTDDKIKIALDKKEVFKLLESSETFGTVLHAICLSAFGSKIYKVDSVELYAMIQDEFGTLLHEEGESKLMAIITSITTPFFFSDVKFFASVCNTMLEGDPGVSGPDDLGFEEPTMLEVIWAMYEVGLNIEGIEYSPSVENYVNQILADENTDADEDPTEIREKLKSILDQMSAELKIQLIKAGFKNIPVLPDSI